MRSILSFVCLSLVFSSLAFAETAITEKIKGNKEEDTAILIKKGGYPLTQPDFEIVSGTDEVIGEPVAGQKDAYQSWKTSCKEWKQEMREMNQENQVIALSCGTPSKMADAVLAGVQTYRSQGSYKVKVRVRGTSTSSKR